MKRIAIAVVALPLTCMGTGYAAGLALIPTPPENVSAFEDGTETTPQEEAVAEEHGAEPETDETADPADPHATGAPEQLNAYALAEDRTVIRVGQITIPVEKLHSVSYVVADFALKMESLEVAERYKKVEEATRIRDSLLTAMNLAAESAVLRSVAIDSDALSQMILGLLGKDYDGIDDVMFVSLYKQDVARL